MRVAIAAGGTGGHVFPAVAVAAALLGRNDSVLWIGRPGSLEETEAKTLGAEFVGISLSGLKRKLCWANVKALLEFIRGRGTAKRVLTAFDPAVLFALGSYVSAPVISAALALRVPVALHEQNVVPGLVVNTYANRVTALLLTKPLQGEPVRENARVVGMPIRTDIQIERTDQWYLELGLDPGKKTLFVFGGSQGAKTFCETAAELGRIWEQDRPTWQIFLQTGARNYEWAKTLITTGNIIPIAHISEMGKAYACADVIVARSGAVSCAELEIVGKPAVLVPYPYATRDHQRLNAEAFLATHEGHLVSEESLSADELDRILGELSEEYPVGTPSDEAALPVARIIEVLDELGLGGER